MPLESDKANYEVFNVGSGQPTTIREVAKVVLNLYQSTLKPEVTGKFRSFDVRHCFANVSKVKRLTGCDPKVSFTEGMHEVFEWSRSDAAKDSADEAMKELETRGLR